MSVSGQTTPRPLAVPGYSAPAAGLDAPFEVLAACHERVERMLVLQAKLQQHLLDHGCDESARQAARDVMRYFDLAAPLHHQDEELHVFPPLLAGSDAALRALAECLMQEHREMAQAWPVARSVLQRVADSSASGWTPLTPTQNGTLNAFSALYRQHLDDENNIVFSAAQAMLAPAAVQAMSEDMMQRRGVPLKK